MLDLVTQIALTAAQLFPANLRFKLKGRKGFGHKARYAHGDLRRGALPAVFSAHLVPNLQHLVGQRGYAVQILVGFRGQAHHKVQFNLTPAAAESHARHAFQIGFQHALVDHVPQTLGTCFRRKGQAGLFPLLHLIGQIHGEIIHAQRRQRNADIFRRHLRNQTAQQNIYTGIIAGAQ